MKAIGIWKALPADDREALVEREIPVPVPGPDDLLVRVEAVSVNPADIRTRMRKTEDGQFAVLGWDVAGKVVATGAQVRDFAPGDRVLYAGDLSRPGANSEYHLVEHAIVGHRPEALGPAAAAALPLTALTAWEALFDRLGLTPGAAPGPCTLLIVGGAGGVGSMAIQLARLVPGLTVIATASRPQSRSWCLSLGADAVIDHFADMETQLADLGLAPPGFVLLANDPDRHFPSLARLIAPGGRICCIVPFASPPDIDALMRKSAGLVWEFMFTRPMFATPDRARQGEILTRIAQMAAEGQLSPTGTETLSPISADTLREAHRRIESGRTIGKIVLSGF
uniref:zinc-binding alcohol dehydrogenase family protein n=1 Tax=Paenirhodobacter enshiensis TaxID=1105367 RepID=UPI0035B1CFB1